MILENFRRTERGQRTENREQTENSKPEATLFPVDRRVEQANTIKSIITTIDNIK